MRSYKIISHYSVDMLELLVDGMIADGWECIGGAFASSGIHFGDSAVSIVFHQSMTRPSRREQ